MEYKEIKGNIITLAKEGNFDVIAHGANCFCTMGSGLAPQMAEAFGANNFNLEGDEYKGDINKLGQIDYKGFLIDINGKAFEPLSIDESSLIVVNCYSQYSYGSYRKGGVDKPIDYDALALCFKKMNHTFKGKHIGLPLIGCGLAGGEELVVLDMIKTTFIDCDITIVRYDG